MDELQYDTEKTVRENVTAELDEHNYEITKFTLDDNPEKHERTLTIKAKRNLAYEQTRIPGA